MKINKAFCLFEQSGTFKREFIRLGIPAEDYDILNDFGETDHVIDLFEQIERAYKGEQSLFDEIGQDDIVIAFFPCTRFESQSSMLLNGNHCSVKKMSDDKKLEYAIKTHAELNRLYTLICQLLIISIRGGVEAHSRKSGDKAALFDLVLSYQARVDRRRPFGKRRLFQKAHAILVCEL